MFLKKDRQDSKKRNYLKKITKSKFYGNSIKKNKKNMLTVKKGQYILTT